MIEAYTRTPEGMIDIPFIYVFNGLALTDGAIERNLGVSIDGDSAFILRRIANVPSVMNPAVGNGFRYRNESREEAMSNLQLMSNDYTVVPEKYYGPKALIGFDVVNVLRRVRVANCDGVQDIRTPFICFQGVRRKLGTGSFSQYESNYAFREQPFEYTLDITVNTPAFTALNALSPEIEFVQEIKDDDFELQEIRVVRATTGAAIGQDEFGLRIMDPSGFQALSNAPVPIGVLNSNQTVGNFFSTFPVPTLVYPVDSVIRLKLTSFLCVTEIPRSYQIKLRGVNRVAR